MFTNVYMMKSCVRTKSLVRAQTKQMADDMFYRKLNDTGVLEKIFGLSLPILSDLFLFQLELGGGIRSNNQ
jgi:hypothetical protein